MSYLNNHHYANTKAYSKALEEQMDRLWTVYSVTADTYDYFTPEETAAYEAWHRAADSTKLFQAERMRVRYCLIHAGL